MPVIDQKDKISIKVDPSISQAEQDSRKLAEFFRNKLNEMKRKHAVIKK